MKERVKRLSSDEFEGRGPGTAGGQKATEYIASQLKAAGVKPGNGKSYFQNVRMVGVKADPKTVLHTTGVDPAGSSFNFGDDFVATTGAQVADVDIRSNFVFVGYGIVAPEYNWNDYKGDPEQYKGKWLVILVNDPPATADEPGLFGAKALTYYGRWTYKYEEAARHGAAGVLLVHSNESAGYGWNVVRSSNGSWRYEIARDPGDATPFLKVRAWMTTDAAAKLFQWAMLDLKTLKEQAKRRDFTPVTASTTLSINLKSELKRFDSPNVVGIVEGADRKLKSEYVVYSAHWDHLGIGEPDAKGDNIYNGAYDNASGVATVLGIAEAFAKMPVRERPKRSFLFLFPTAEEQGLLGAEYYSKHLLIPLRATVANINIDGVNFFGKVKDFMALGADRSTLSGVVKKAADERSLAMKLDMNPEQGFFFRSDHFPFAKVGVPAISLQHGDDYVVPLKGDALEFERTYTAKYYHQASDEFHDWWDMSAMIQEADFAASIGAKIANDPSSQTYVDRDEFSAADKARRSARRKK